MCRRFRRFVREVVRKALGGAQRGTPNYTTPIEHLLNERINTH